MTPCGFNLLTPAFIFSANLTSLAMVGPLDIGTSMYYGQANGFMRSVPGFPVRVNATIIHIDDVPTLDPTNVHLSLRGALMTDDGTNIVAQMEGPLRATPKVADILGAAPHAVATEWGEEYSAFFWRFFVKNGTYQVLEDSQFVGSARVYPGDGKGVYASLEYRISKVETGPLCKD